MHRHERNAFGRIREILILISLQTHLTQEIRDWRIIDTFFLTLRNELTDRIKQLLYVLRPVNTLRRHIGRQGGHHAGHTQHRLRKTICVHCLALLVEEVDHLCKRLQSLHRCGIHIQSRCRRRAHHLQVTFMMLHGIHRHFLHRCLTNSPSGKANDTQQSLVIAGIDREAQVTQDVFDLLALVERRTAVNTVRDIPFTQLALERTALRIRTIQDRHIVIAVLPMRCDDLQGHTFRFCAVVHIGFQVQRCSLLFLRIYLLVDLLAVLMYQRVSRIHDILRRAVVTLQFEHLRRGIYLPEIENITDVRPSERVDTLRIIAHHTDIILWFGEAFHEQELDIVRILVLIHQNILELLLVFLPHLGTAIQQPERVDQQIVKIHGIGCFQTCLVQLIDRCRLVHTHLPVLAQQLLVHTILGGSNPCVLRHRDTAQHRRRLVHLLIQSALLAYSLDDRLAIRGIIDREIASEAQ